MILVLPIDISEILIDSVLYLHFYIYKLIWLIAIHFLRYFLCLHLFYKKYWPNLTNFYRLIMHLLCFSFLFRQIQILYRNQKNNVEMQRYFWRIHIWNYWRWKIDLWYSQNLTWENKCINLKIFLQLSQNIVDIL